MAKFLEKGDIILVSNSPKLVNNNEQKGTRPWLVMSLGALNQVSPFVWAVPFTTSKRTYPLVVDWNKLNTKSKTRGILLTDQLTCLDIQHRPYRLLEHVEVPLEVDNIVLSILGAK